MTSDRTSTDTTGIRGDFNRARPDPVAKLAYYRCVARRLREVVLAALGLVEGFVFFFFLTACNYIRGKIIPYRIFIIRFVLNILTRFFKKGFF